MPSLLKTVIGLIAAISLAGCSNEKNSESINIIAESMNLTRNETSEIISVPRHRPDELMLYIRTPDALSDKIILVKVGKTWEIQAEFVNHDGSECTPVYGVVGTEWILAATAARMELENTKNATPEMPLPITK